jgi:hypothetical protein
MKDYKHASTFTGFPCPNCGKTFSRIWNLRVHLQKCNDSASIDSDMDNRSTASVDIYDPMDIDSASGSTDTDYIMSDTESIKQEKERKYL